MAAVLAILTLAVAPAPRALAQGGASHLGINISDPMPGLDGVIVIHVVPGSGAEAAGLRPGDRVVAVDGRKVASTTDIVCAVQARPPGATVTLDVRRSEEGLKLSPRLGHWPDELPPPRMRDCEAMY